jgi:hypothetical protein
LGKIDTWDYQLTFLHWQEGLHAVIPRKNLVSNIGFGPSATHTINSSSQFSNQAIEMLRFPLFHPTEVVRDSKYDLAFEKLRFRLSLVREYGFRLVAKLPIFMQVWARVIYGGFQYRVRGGTKKNL